MSIIKQEWWCKVNERPDTPISGLQKEQERGFWGNLWEKIKLLFTWVG